MNNGHLIARTKRTLTSILPVAKNRTGKCIGCGRCCISPSPCLFLSYRPDGTAYCKVYTLRPLNCRKYPRTESECFTADTCGFKFE